MNTVESLEKELTKSNNFNPNYYYNPYNNANFDYAMMNPYFNYIRSPPVNYPYYPNQSINASPNNYPNHMNQMNSSPMSYPSNMNINNSNIPNNNNLNLDLQNKNFQMKVSLLKFESENKALKDKIIELSNSMTSLQSNIAQTNVTKNKKNEGEGSKEHESMIKDLQSKVNGYLI